MSDAARWKLAPVDAAAVRRLAADLRASETLATLLLHRGVADLEAARAFLDPKLSALEPPEAMLDVPRAAERIARAIREGERIVVFGDYDVDGMTGTSLWANFLKLANANYGWYVPDRLKEGYSFGDVSLDRILGSSHPPRVVVTVDHGTSSHAALKRLRAAGVDAIVTDHHEPPDALPTDAYAIVNPRRRDDASRAKDLCGAGVTFKVVWAVAQKLSASLRVSDEFRNFLVDATAYVALATVADVVRLFGDNRVLCANGLRALKASSRPGVRSLLRSARLEGRDVRAVHVGFRLGPRLNAAGRLGTAEKAIELLTTDDVARADALVEELEDANRRRREIEGIVLREAEAMVRADPPLAEDALCLGSERWHAGVIGIVAARLAEKHRLPTMIVALDGDESRGSARAPEGVHLRDLLAKCADHLRSFGGHAGAAGCTVAAAAFPEFRRAFRAAAREALLKDKPDRTLTIDMELPFSKIGPSLVEDVERLAPFGAGNPAPVFCTHDVRFAGRPRAVGESGAHLRGVLTDGSRSWPCVGFGMGASAAAFGRPEARLSAAYRVKFDTFRSAEVVELELLDVRSAR